MKPARRSVSYHGERPTGSPSTRLMTSSRRPAVGQQLAQRAERGRRDGRVVEGRQRLERAAAAVQVQRGEAVDEDDRGARRRAGTGGGRRRPGAATGRRRRTGFAGIGGGEEVHAGIVAGRARRARGRRAADRARRRARTARRRARRRSSRAGCGRPPRARGASGRPRRSRPRGPRPSRTRGPGRRGGRAGRARAGGAAPSGSAACAAASQSAAADERPAAGRLGRAEARQPAEPRRAAPLPLAAAGRFQRRARSGAKVSLVTSPAQTRSHSASRTSRSRRRRPARCRPRPGCARKNEAPRRREVLADGLVERRRPASAAPSGRPRRAAAARGPADGGRRGRRRGRGCRGRPTRPRPARRARRAAAAGSRGCGPGARRAPARRRESARPASWSTTSASRSSAALPRSGGGFDPTGDDALPRRQEPPERLGIDRLDLAPEPRERAAAEHPEDLRVAPLALRAARAELAADDRAGRGEPRQRVLDDAERQSPARAPARCARNGPWLRAKRASRPSSAPVTRTRNASGTPRGGEAPTPSRYRADVLDRDPALVAARSASGPRAGVATSSLQPAARAAAAPPSTRAAASAADRSPIRRSRSWRCSRLLAWRSSVSDWSDSSRSASASGSSSSRSSSWPSSSRSRSRSSASAPARRSASGASPSYMYAAT